MKASVAAHHVCHCLCHVLPLDACIKNSQSSRCRRRCTPVVDHRHSEYQSVLAQHSRHTGTKTGSSTLQLHCNHAPTRRGCAVNMQRLPYRGAVEGHAPGNAVGKRREQNAVPDNHAQPRTWQTVTSAGGWRLAAPYSVQQEPDCTLSRKHAPASVGV